MMELFLIKTIAGQVSLFLACLALVMFLHRFFKFRHVLFKSIKLYAVIAVVSFLIRMIGSIEKVYWMTKAMRFFM